MQKENKVPKITKVLIKDFKGERIVYQNSDNGKIVIPQNDGDNAYIKIKKNYTWGLAWRILVVIFIIDFSIFSYFTFYKKIGFIEGLNGWINSSRQFVYGHKKNDQIISTQEQQFYYPQKKQTAYKTTKKPT